MSGWAVTRSSDTGPFDETEMRIAGRLLGGGETASPCACGIMVHEALKAARILFQQGINAEAIIRFCFGNPCPPDPTSLRRTGLCCGGGA